MKNGVELRRELANDLPLIYADNQQIVQVLVNLISNATDAMKESNERKLFISTSLENELIQVVVEDTGPGMPSEKLDNIWEPFFTTKPKGKGTGLGLSISHGIIQAHSASITAENTDRGGMRFVLKFPMIIE